MPAMARNLGGWRLHDGGRSDEVCRRADVSQKVVVIEFKGFTREEPLRFDVLVEGCVLLEAKAVEKILPIHKAQLLS